jgi:hypothetical protein
MIFNLLMMKHKELETAGFSAFEIDEHLPLSKQDDEDMPRSKKRRRPVIVRRGDMSVFVSNFGLAKAYSIECTSLGKWNLFLVFWRFVELDFFHEELFESICL